MAKTTVCYRFSTIQWLSSLPGAGSTMGRT
jgi:hypothetical protein